MSTALRKPVAICFRNPLLRKGLSLILQENNFDVALCVADPDILLTETIEVGVLLSDDAIAAVGLDAIKKRLPHINIIILAERIKEKIRRSAELAGARVLLHSIDCEQLMAEIENFAQDNRALGQLPIKVGGDASAEDHFAQASTVAAAPARGARRRGLSDRELQILEHISKGYSNREIAKGCGLAETTVKVHLKSIMRKLDVENRTQAALWVINNRISSFHVGKEKLNRAGVSR